MQGGGVKDGTYLKLTIYVYSYKTKQTHEISYKLFRNKAVEIVGIVEPCSHPKSVMAELESIEILASKYNVNCLK